MGIIETFNDHPLVQGMAEVSRYGIPFVGGIAFGPSYAGLNAGKEFNRYVCNPKNYKSNIDKYTLFGALGIPFSKAIDRWLISTGGKSLAETRVYLTFQNIPTKAKVLSGVFASYAATKGTTNLIESVFTGAQNPVTGTRSAKPSWLPLPLWYLMN